MSATLLRVMIGGIMFGVLLWSITLLAWPPIGANVIYVIGLGFGYMWAFNDIMPVDTLVLYGFYAFTVELAFFIVRLVGKVVNLFQGHPHDFDSSSSGHSGSAPRTNLPF